MTRCEMCMMYCTYDENGAMNCKDCSFKDCCSVDCENCSVQSDYDIDE